jgi:hypothetical protein
LTTTLASEPISTFSFTVPEASIVSSDPAVTISGEILISLISKAYPSSPMSCVRFYRYIYIYIDMSYIFFFKKILTAINDMNIAYIMMRVQR